MPKGEFDERRRPETPDVARRPVLIFSLGFVAFALLSSVGIKIFLNVKAPVLLHASTRAYPEPSLQAAPRADYAEYAKAARADLERTGWQDRDKGLARVPIEKAMALVVARGARAFDPVTNDADATNGGSGR